MKKYQWMDGSGRECGLPVMTMYHAKHGYHAGECVYSINELMADIDMSNVNIEQSRKILTDYGIEDIHEKTEHEIKELILWIACGDISENPEIYEI